MKLTTEVIRDGSPVKNLNLDQVAVEQFWDFRVSSINNESVCCCVANLENEEI